MAGTDEVTVEWQQGIDYEHGCRDCGEFWVERYKLNDEPPDTCPSCGSKDVYRCVGSAGFELAGGGVGWERDGYYSYNNRDSLKNLGNKVTETSKESFMADLDRAKDRTERGPAPGVKK